MQKLRIMIVEDQTLLRDSLQTILDMEDDMEVIGVAADGDEAYRRIRECHPDLVLMDIQMPKMDGIECTRRVKRDYPQVKILILTTFAEEEYIVDALANGAQGFLVKDIPGDKLLGAIRDAIHGQLMLPGVVAEKLAKRLMHKNRTKVANGTEEKLGFTLTERDKSIISLMLRGMSNQQIAQTLFITEGTVKNYVSSIYGKIGIHERSKAVIYLQTLNIEH
ncbi:response regulator transcription factor [Alicyclobacillus suci]|uniref:response regulator transcription factor n=1 Tax=Alicyclobacillus suci TaxID=2816080 RepID=UPI001A8FFDF5|nr:response regulator transcription factor [Alicyclobacillus suci]